MVRKVLLTCGIAAALIYVGSDVFAALSWEGYSYTGQSVSELRAIGAPTRALLVPLLLLYAGLEMAYAVGVWQSARTLRGLHITAALLFALGVLDLTAYFAPMQPGAPVSAPTNTAHLVATGVTVLAILLIIGLGAVAGGRWFHIYSYITIVIIIVAGVIAGLGAPKLAAGLPTPWLGVWERLNIYAYMLWMVLLALVLWPAKADEPTAPLGPAPVAPA